MKANLAIGDITLTNVMSFARHEFLRLTHKPVSTIVPAVEYRVSAATRRPRYCGYDYSPMIAWRSESAAIEVKFGRARQFGRKRAEVGARQFWHVSTYFTRRLWHGFCIATVNRSQKMIY